MFRFKVCAAVLLRVSARVTAVGLLVNIAACTGDSSSSQSNATGTFISTTSIAAQAPGVGSDSTAYCDQVALLDGDRPEAYVGSAEHRADVASLIDVAPESLRGPLNTFSEFLGSGAITADEPDSNVIDNWPPAVQQAIREITAYNSTTC